jgi:hypothetical protein
LWNFLERRAVSPLSNTHFTGDNGNVKERARTFAGEVELLEVGKVDCGDLNGKVSIVWPHEQGQKSKGGASTEEPSTSWVPVYPARARDRNIAYMVTHLVLFAEIQKKVAARFATPCPEHEMKKGLCD